MDCVALPALSARVWGAAFTDSHCGGLLDGFEVEKEIGTIDIMCVHGEVGARESVYDPITEDGIARSGMDYIALGHIHKESGLRRAGIPIMPGPAARRGAASTKWETGLCILSRWARGLAPFKRENIFAPVCGFENR